MYRLLVVSDTHRSLDGVRSLIRNLQELNGIIHCGDVNADISSLNKEFPSIPIYGVQGNNDYFNNDYPTDLEVSVEGKKIFITHGHLYYVRTGNSSLHTLIDEKGYDLICYGHTHIPDTEYYSNSIILNPGSARGYGATYGIVEIENGKLKTAILRI